MPENSSNTEAEMTKILEDAKAKASATYDAFNTPGRLIYGITHGVRKNTDKKYDGERIRRYLQRNIDRDLDAADAAIDEFNVEQAQQDR